MGIGLNPSKVIVDNIGPDAHSSIQNIILRSFAEDMKYRHAACWLFYQDS